MRDSLIGLMRMSKGHLQLIALTLSFFFFLGGWWYAMLGSWWVLVPIIMNGIIISFVIE